MERGQPQRQQAQQRQAAGDSDCSARSRGTSAAATPSAARYRAASDRPTLGYRPGPGARHAGGQLAATQHGPHASGHVLADLARVVPGDGRPPRGSGARQPHGPPPARGDPGHARCRQHHRGDDPPDRGIGHVVAHVGPLRRHPLDHEPQAGQADDGAGHGAEGDGAPRRAPPSVALRSVVPGRSVLGGAQRTRSAGRTVSGNGRRWRRARAPVIVR